jgi:hypothetical protein
MEQKPKQSLEELMSSLQEVSEVFNAALKEIEEEQEAYWYSLTHDQQLSVFCSVVRRIHLAEITERTSYRGALYGVFGFGPEAYIQAQEAGYLDIHNEIFTSIDERNRVRKETVDACASIVMDAVNRRVPASEYVGLIVDYFGMAEEREDEDT